MKRRKTNAPKRIQPINTRDLANVTGGAPHFTSWDYPSLNANSDGATCGIAE